MQIQSIQPPVRLGNEAVQAAPARSVKPGDTLNATVTSATSERVTLALEDGTTLTASREGASTLRPGDAVVLQAGGAENGKPSLSLVSINEQPTTATATNTELMLLEMKLAPSTANVNYAQTLKSMALPVTANSIGRFATLAAAFPKLNSPFAAIFAASDIPVTRENVAAFTEWLSSPVNAGELANAITTLAQADPQLADTLAQALARSAPSGTAQGVEQAALPQEALTQQPSAQAAAAQTAQPGQAAQLPVDGQIQPGATPTQGNPAEAMPVPAKTQQGQSAVEFLPQNTEAASQNANAVLGEELNATAPRTQPESAPQAARQTIAPQQDTNSEALQPGGSDRAATSFEASARTGTEATIQRSVADILDGMFKAISKSDLAERGETVREAVSKLPDSVARLSQALSEAADKSGALGTAARQTGALFTQLQMGTEMGMLMYAQIPLRTNDANRAAELYVMKRNSGTQSIDPANTTIAICLDTEHMGLVESLLHVEHNDMSLKLRVENERVRKYVESNLSKLYGMEFPSQYKFRSAVVSLADTAITPATAAKVMTDAFSRGSIAPGGLDIIV